ncbi:MAG: hypothetical protein K9L31_00480 [Candidatus Pacebacteria bacterium]|nr:hypothetical protein [Candidatus Paceibacterota bacterium]
MNTPENNSGGPSDPSRRSFLGKMFGVAAVGVVAAVGGNKYIEEEKEIGSLMEHLSGQEENLAVVNEAATMLIDEMNKDNINEVKTFGTGHPNKRIDVLRTFLSKYLNSKTGQKNQSRDKILNSGVFNRENLTDILSATTR